jgi:iron complex transport system substrate-binding protein
MLRAIVVLLVSTMGLVAHAFADPIGITDDRGHAQTFASTPLRIVTLLPSLTEAVCALDACARLVGTDSFSNWPAAVASLPKLGGLEDATVEGIAALHPDVVLAGTSSRVIDRLEELGIPVVALEPKSLSGIHRVLSSLALLLGNPSEGERVWQRMDAQIAAAAARVPVAIRGGRVYFEIAEAPYAAGASSFIGELLARLGLGNIVPADLGPFPRLNPEYVIRAQPDLIMTSERELSGMASRPGWDTLTALRTGHSCGFASADIDVMVRPGPRLGEAAGVVVACLSKLPVNKSSASAH